MHHVAVRLKEVIKKISKVFMIFPFRKFYQSIYSLIMLWLNDLQVSEVYCDQTFCLFEIATPLKTL